MANGTASSEPQACEPDQPVISAVVIARDDETVIERAVDALATQQCHDPFEIIVVTSGTDRTADTVREKFPDVQVIALDHPALPGEARNAGLWAARGVYVTFPGSHIVVAPEFLAAGIDAHRQGYAMVSGAVRNGTPTLAGWASYFLDHGPALPGRPSEPLDETPRRCSYLRAALLEVGGFPEDVRVGEDTVAISELVRRGYGAYHERGMTLTHRSPCTTTTQLVRHHFMRGRGMGRILFEAAELDGRIPNERMIRFATRGAPARLRQLSRHMHAWGDGLRVRYRLVLPLIVAGAVSWWLGAWYELVRRTPAARRRLRAGRTR